MSDQWPLVPLAEVCTLITDGTHHSPPNSASGAYRYVTAKNIRPWGLDLSNITYVDQRTHREIYTRCPVEQDDVLYIKDGATSGLAAVNNLAEPFSMLSSVALLKPDRRRLNSHFLKFYLNSPQVVTAMTGAMTGSAIRRLVLRQIRAAEIPLPPLAEQHRIVAKLDALLTRVNACRDRLDRIPKLLARFRQSVLAAACSGEWRTHSVGTLLAGIDAGRSFTCEERPPRNGEIGVLKISALTWERFDENESKTCHERSRWNPAFAVRKGDFLISRANTIELVGACVIVHDISKRLMLSDKTLRLRFKGVRPEWALLCLRSKLGRSQIESLATGNQQSMRNISQESLRSIEIPVPSLAEQGEIVNRANNLLRLADRLEARVAEAHTKVDSLTQSILAKAFRGELVRTEAELAAAEGRDFESASQLLDRIRSQHQPNAPKRKATAAARR